MTDKPDSDRRIYFSKKRKMILDGEVTSHSTATRWTKDGVTSKSGKLVILECWYRGRRKYTTESAVKRFFAAQNEDA